MKLIKKIQSALSNNSRSKDALLVIVGTVFGQVAIVLATPILTRLYQPEQMGVYAVYASIIGLFSIVIAGHYELAIPLPKTNIEARRILKLCVLVVLTFSALLAITFVPFADILTALFNAEGLRPYFWIIPIGCCLCGLAVVLSYWSIRQKTFHLTAWAKGLQGAGQVAPQVVLGFLNFGVIGLIVGQLLGQIASAAALIKGLPKRELQRASKDSAVKIALLAKKYRRFPMITMWSSIINSLSAHLPILVLASIFGPVVTGLYALSFRILQVPAKFIGMSISQVFFSVAVQARREKNLAFITKDIFRGLYAFGLPSFLALAVISPPLFAWAFGDVWLDAGVYSQRLMPWVFLSFLSTTLSILVTVLNQQGKEFIFQFAMFVTTVFSLWLGVASAKAILLITLMGSLCAVILAVKIIWLLRISGVAFFEILEIVLKELPAASAMIVALLVVQHLQLNPLVLMATAILTLLLIHGYNFRVRKIYGFAA